MTKFKLISLGIVMILSMQETSIADEVFTVAPTQTSDQSAIDARSDADQTGDIITFTGNTGTHTTITTSATANPTRSTSSVPLPTYSGNSGGPILAQ